MAFAPMPRARVMIAVSVKPGDFSNCRRANFRSLIMIAWFYVNGRRRVPEKLSRSRQIEIQYGRFAAGKMKTPPHMGGFSKRICLGLAGPQGLDRVGQAFD